MDAEVDEHLSLEQRKESYKQELRELVSTLNPNNSAFIEYLLKHDDFVDSQIFFEDKFDNLLEAFCSDARVVYLFTQPEGISAHQQVARYPHGGYKVFIELFEQIACLCAELVDSIFQKFLKSRSVQLGLILNSLDFSIARSRLHLLSNDEAEAYEGFFNYVDELARSSSEDFNQISDVHNHDLQPVRLTLLCQHYKKVVLEGPEIRQMIEDAHRQEVEDTLNRERSSKANTAKSKRWQPVKNYAIHRYQNGLIKHKKKAASAMASDVRQFALQQGIEMTHDPDNATQIIYKWILNGTRKTDSNKI